MPAAASLHIAGATLVDPGTGKASSPVDILVERGRITSVSAASEAARDDRRPRHEGRLLDASRHIAIPGLVNAHTHSPDNLIRGCAPELPLELWSLHSASGREGRTPRETYVAALLGAIEMLRTGTTTVLDHIRLSPRLTPEGLEAAGRAYLDIGMRAVIAPVVADKPYGETLPFLPGEACTAAAGPPMPPAAWQLGLVEDFVRAWHGREGRIGAAIGPSGPQRCTTALLEGAAELSRRHEILFHTHTLETRPQREMGLGLHRDGMISFLAEHGLLSRRTNLVHAIWLEAGDVERIARSGASIVHNPVSNAKLGSGVCDLPALLAAGVRVGLGTDSACCNDGNNLFDTMKWTALLHNFFSRDTERWVGPARALRLATLGGADALGLADRVGRIAPGMAADIVLLRLDSPAFVPLIEPVRQLVESENGSSVDTVIVAGEIVVENGRCARIDEAAIWAEARELAAARLAANAGVMNAAAGLAEPIRRLYSRIDAERDARIDAERGR